VELGASAVSSLQIHEHHPGIFETSSEVFRVQSGHRVSQPRVGLSGLDAQASELTPCDELR
jgi:hypothetical protein